MMVFKEGRKFRCLLPFETKDNILFETHKTYEILEEPTSADGQPIRGVVIDNCEGRWSGACLMGLAPDTVVLFKQCMEDITYEEDEEDLNNDNNDKIMEEKIQL